MIAETGEISTTEFVLPSFRGFWRACRVPSYTHYYCKGGRNSSKSTTISERLIFDVMDLPITVLVMRRVANTMVMSVFEQIKESARIMGVQEYFRFFTNPMRIVYMPRGNGFVFRGADDPLKLKSIKVSGFPIGRLWIEEVSEFKTEDDVQTIVDSVLRHELPDGVTYKCFYSYNPPRRRQHWLNKKCESHSVPPNTYIHHSSYHDNPYLSRQTLQEIEIVKELNPRKYEWMYEGKPTGGGLIPFENLTFRKITDAEAASFNNIKQGLDWGYATDPVAFVRLHYDKTRRKIFFIDEIYGVKMSNRELAEELKARGYHGTRTIADSAEPKSVAEIASYGVNIIAATKGPGSVEHGEKWLDDLEEIVIDPDRTPNVSREWESIEYAVDRDGNIITRLEDKDNHTIDSTRYALESDMSAQSGKVLFAL